LKRSLGLQPGSLGQDDVLDDGGGDGKKWRDMKAKSKKLWSWFGYMHC
jgi:hypothetical protein